MAHPTSTDKPRLFHGWWVVTGAFTVTLVGFGSAYTFSAFLEPLQRDFDASRGSVSLVFSLAGFLYFSLGMITGPLADRFGSRPLAMFGMLLTGAGLAAAGIAQSLVQVYLAYGLGVGLGIGCSYVPAIGAVQRWFSRRRGFASGIAVSGIGVGTLIMPPLATVLIEAFGWRNAYLVLGAVAALVGVTLAFLIENDPGGRGLHPDGDVPLADARPAPVSDLAILDAVRSRPFLALYGACLVASFGLFVPFVHLVPFSLDQGHSPAAAAMLLGLIGIGSTAGRFFLGSLADRIGRHRALMTMFAGMALSLLIWLFCTGLAGLGAFAFSYGIFYGGFVAVLPAIVMDYFGGRNVSGIIGVLYTSVALGTLIGPSAAGFAYDVSHSYTLAITASLITNLIAALMVAGLARNPAHGE
ncbi:MFS transporter [Alloalcanivorax mobilis]|uniref:MFS transporter n=1 Tax=Alloalcanivorax mobilis TaxID=2019569 RepID=UPI000C769046|nr:MFS transporter [Alloalcanivorax mobilis]